MDKIIKQFTHLTFAPGQDFMWSPREQMVYYDPDRVDSNPGQLALLHEIGHAELRHNHIRSDMHLVGMEVDAWSFARQYAPEFAVAIDDEHIDACLESYRIWAYKRAVCPNCQFHGIQTQRRRYYCFTCRHTWRVSTNLTLQPHRRQCQDAAFLQTAKQP